LKSDPWLSQILGKPAYHLSGAAFTPPDGRAFIDAKVAVDDTAALLHLQVQGFAVMDANVQLLRPAGAMPAGAARVRPAAPADEPAVRAVAADAFVYDRFHRDPGIGHDAAARLKTEWASNYFSGKRGDRMIVTEDESGVCGFLQLLRGTDGGTIIDLIAVAGHSRGRGAARSMIAMAANTADTGALRVGTQLANLPSLGLYETLGFRMASAAYVLHLHAGENP
jgi:ribosomal protein S18 acetylase RimI-like enzyme